MNGGNWHTVQLKPDLHIVRLYASLLEYSSDAASNATRRYLSPLTRMAPMGHTLNDADSG